MIFPPKQIVPIFKCCFACLKEQNKTKQLSVWFAYYGIIELEIYSQTNNTTIATAAAATATTTSTEKVDIYSVFYHSLKSKKKKVYDAR